MLNKDTLAPDFELHATPDQKFTLKELRGKNVILAFYPADWSPVCGDQMSLYNEMLKYFKKFNAELLGISVDGKWCAMPLTGSIEIYNSHCWQILSRRVIQQKNTEYTIQKLVNATELCLYWMEMGSSSGVTFLL